MHTSVITIFVVVFYTVEIKTYDFANTNIDRDDSIGSSKLIYRIPIESSRNMNYRSEKLSGLKEHKENKGKVISTEDFQTSGQVHDKKDISSEIIENNQSKRIYDAKLPEGNQRLNKEDNGYSLENRRYGVENVKTMEVNEDVPFGPGFSSNNIMPITRNGSLHNELLYYPLDAQNFTDMNQGQKKNQSQYTDLNEKAPQKVYRDTTKWNQDNNAYEYQPDTDNNDDIWNDNQLKNVEPVIKIEEQNVTGEIPPMVLSSNAYVYEPEDVDNNLNNANALL